MAFRALNIEGSPLTFWIQPLGTEMKKESLALFLFIIVLSVSRFGFLCSGPGSFDSALYLIGAAQIEFQGLLNAESVFNHDTSIGFYTIAHSLTVFGDTGAESVMNRLLVLNGFAGIGVILLIGLIGRQNGLGGGGALLLLIVSALLPRLWALSLIVQPVVLATLLFLGALAAELKATQAKRSTFRVLACLLWTLALLFRADIVLGTGALLFLPWKEMERKQIFLKRLGIVALGFAIASIPRILLGTGEANTHQLFTLENFSTYISIAHLPEQVFKYSLHTFLSVHPLIILGGIGGGCILFFTGERRTFWWLFAWWAGSLPLLLFRDIDFARIVCWTHPLWVLALVLGWRRFSFTKKKVWLRLYLAAIPLSSILLGEVAQRWSPGDTEITLEERLGMDRYNQPIGFLPLEWSEWNHKWKKTTELANIFSKEEPGKYNLHGSEGPVWTAVWMEVSRNGPLRADRIEGKESLVYVIDSRNKHMVLATNLYPNWSDLDWTMIR